MADDNEELDALFKQCEAQYEAEQAARQVSVPAEVTDGPEEPVAAPIEVVAVVAAEAEDDLIHLPAYAEEAGRKFVEAAQPPPSAPKSKIDINRYMREMTLAKLAKQSERKRGPGRPAKVLADPTEGRLITIKVPDTMHFQFKQYCQLRRLVMSDVLRNYIEGLIEDADNSPEALRRIEFEQWYEKYKNIKGANMERMLEVFRKTEEEISNNGKKQE